MTVQAAKNNPLVSLLSEGPKARRTEDEASTQIPIWAPGQKVDQDALNKVSAFTRAASSAAYNG